MNKIKFKLKTSLLNIDFEGDKSELIELTNFFSEINRIASDVDINMEELVSNVPLWKLSKELQLKKDTINQMEDLLEAESGMIVEKISFNNVNEINDNGTTVSLNFDEIKQGTKKFLQQVDVTKANYLIVHIISNVDKEYCSIIYDNIKRHLPHVDTKLIKTKKNILEKTIVECVFFGDYSDEE
ncbi:hypothetical protein KY334_02925 [Candidatus Woesearchaeota archaeon]|nr:hypothetical protein [Candidatus Woesearchaeota archaeon]